MHNNKLHIWECLNFLWKLICFCSTLVVYEGGKKRWRRKHGNIPPNQQNSTSVAPINLLLTKFHYLLIITHGIKMRGKKKQ